MKKGTEAINISDQTSKFRRPKSREVSSRYLSPTSTTSSHDNGIPSPNQSLSPIHRKSTTTTNTSSSVDSRKQRSSLDDSVGLPRGLWPSSTNKNVDTLADHLGNDRYKDLLQRKDGANSEIKNSNALFLDKQRSCSEFSRVGNEKRVASSKENHKPILGGSMRYTGKLKFTGKSFSRNSSNTLSKPSHLVPGRFSVDENTLNGRKKSDSCIESIDSESSECSNIYSGSMDFESAPVGRISSFSSYISPTVSSRKNGIEVSSKYLHDSTSRPNRGSLDSENSTSDNSPRLKRFILKSKIKRANSLTGYGSATTQWALSPGRSSSPPGLIEKKGRSLSFSSLKPPSSPSRAKGVEKLLNMGLDLFKSKKSSSLPNLGSGGNIEAHRLRLLHNGLMQWRYANARADVVNKAITKQSESNLVCAWDSLKRLQHAVVQKRLQLQNEKMEMKLNFILQLQIKPLQTWGEIERQHLSAISMTKDCLHSVACRVPLVDGAKVDPQSASIAVQHASDLTASIKTMLNTLSPSPGKTGFLLSELAEVVAQEKSIIEECLELCKIISVLEIEERSLKGHIIQLRSLQQQG